MKEILFQILLSFSNGLLFPDLLILLGMIVFVFIYLGGLLAEGWERYRHVHCFHRFVTELKINSARKIAISDVPAHFGYPRKIFMQLTHGTAEKIVDDTQLAMEASLSRIILGIRLGPMLGLAGTLIPLGPSLLAMSGGDVASLAGNLSVAFTATVIGLFVAGVCYVIYSIRQRWYAQDINDIEFLLSRLG